MPVRIEPLLYNFESGYNDFKNILISSCDAFDAKLIDLPSPEIEIPPPTEIVKVLLILGSKLECATGENELMLKNAIPVGGSKVH